MQHIFVILNETNCIQWAQAMRSFLKGCKLWCSVTGDITMPVNEKEEDSKTFQSHLEVWDSNNHKINMWFTNTSLDL